MAASRLLSHTTADKVQALNQLAQRRGQTLAQLALAWNLRDPRVTSVLIGASSPAQLDENVAALDNLSFTAEELAEIDRHATDSGINIWAQSSEAG
ncbi:MAG: aldo/keto reductase [Truepera sp.]|nr:aldo/keto reductase [Truepera sp.]